jgi:predicted aspartyl protease
VPVVARNPRQEERATPPIEAIVNTASKLTWLPREAVLAVGIAPRRRRAFIIASRETVERGVGYAIVGAEGYETADEVVFAEPGDFALLGVRTVEGFGVSVDNVRHRFVPRATLVV